jgi:hypothetical protein
MQWGALVLLVAILAAGTVLGWRRQGRPPLLRGAFRYRPAWPASGLRVVDRVMLSPTTSVVRLEWPDGVRMTLVVGGAATIVREEGPAPVAPPAVLRQEGGGEGQD